LISKFFDEIAQDTGKYCYGINDTLYALDLGAVETLVVWENLEMNRVVLRNNSAGTEKVLFLNKEQEKEGSHFVENGIELEVVEKLQVLEWFANNYKKFGATLEIVTNRSQEGSQFCKGFGGIGGLLRYKVDFNANNPTNVDDLDGGSDSKEDFDDIEAYF